MTKKKYHGQLLAAHPGNPDDDLQESVILMISHTADISIGLQINSVIENLSLQEVAKNLGLWWPGNDPLWYGGETDGNKIHVIHSPDWSGLTTIRINDEISLTNDVSVIAALNRGEGPEYYRACAGYRMWANGSLDRQLRATTNTTATHRWETVESTAENIFGYDGHEQWVNTLDNCAQYRVDSWFTKSISK